MSLDTEKLEEPTVSRSMSIIFPFLMYSNVSFISVADDFNRDNNDPGTKTRVLLTPPDTNNQTETKPGGNANRLTLNSILICISFILAYERILHLS